MVIWNKYKIEIVLILLSLASTLIFASHYLFAWDSGQFALGIKNFNINSYQPHPPGYPLFLFFTWILNFIFQDLNFSFIIINAIVGSISSVLIYKIIKNLNYDKKIGLAVALLLIFHPVFWHYRTIALTYSFEVLAPLLGLFFLQSINNKKPEKYFLIHSFLTAILIGFRPSLIIISLPLLLIHWILLKTKLIPTLWGGLIFLITTALWFVPLINLSDGLNNYLTILKNQYSSLPRTFTNPDLRLTYLKSLLIIIGPFGILPFLAKLSNKKNKFFFILNIALFFAILLFYFFSHFSVVGYMLALVPLIFILSLDFFEKLIKYTWAWVIIIIFIFVEIYFFQVPANFIDKKVISRINHATVQEHDQRIKTYLYISNLQKPGETLIISLRGQYYNSEKKVTNYKYDDIKVLASYLPQYKIYDLLGVKNIYFTAYDYHYQQVDSEQIIFPTSTKKILILADYIHPDTKPKGLNLEAHCVNNCPDNYYQADISEINQFRFYGLDFIRAN